MNDDLHGRRDASALPADEVFPVRVINIKDTIATARGVSFSEPNDWNFHTISHTWSMMVSDWSIEVAGKIGGGGRCGYNEVFRNEDFSSRPYYRDFLGFLELLASDGVEKVWFDALCINQTDADEKSREISHMGAFYSKSLGCYVLTHGLGQGFGFLSSDEHLPRWFSRVWTLQEFLLPKQLWFIVELDGAIVENASPLTKRDGRTCFRRVSIDSSDLYFVDRFGYESLLWDKFDGAADDSEGFMATEDKVQFRARLESYWSLPRRSWDTDRWIFSEEYGKRLGHIMREVSFRDCSEGHEEDRVLSILALLGMEGRLQALRVGKSLDEQILELFKALVKVDQSLLLALCTGSVFPYPTAGMSWVPHFYREEGVPRWFNSPPIFSAKAEEAEVMEVSERGLKLSCRFLRAHFRSVEEHRSRCSNPLLCVSCTDDFAYSWVLEIHDGPTFPLLDLSEELSYLMFGVNPFPSSNPRLKFGYGESGLVLNLQEKINSLEALHFSTWLLLIGYEVYYEDDLTKSTSSFLFMVCIGLNKDSLHKVGLIKVEEKNFGDGWNMLSPWYDRPSPKDVFTVGGFGKIPLSQLQTDIVH